MTILYTSFEFWTSDLFLHVYLMENVYLYLCFAFAFVFILLYSQWFLLFPNSSNGSYS